PGVAPAAIQQGRYVGKSIRRLVEGKPVAPFHYWDKGTAATIGRAAAVADLPWIKIAGWAAWWLWLVVHIFYLIGFKNRAFVIFQWAWARFTSGRGARLITGESHPLELKERVQPKALPSKTES